MTHPSNFPPLSPESFAHLHWAGLRIPGPGEALVTPLLGIARTGDPGEVRFFIFPETAGTPAIRDTPCILIAPGGDFGVFFEMLRQEFGPILRMETGGKAAGLFDEISASYPHHGHRDSLQEAGLLYRLLFALHTEQQLEAGSRDAIDFAFRYLQANFHRPINSKTLAARSGVSPEHLIRAFTARYNETPATLLFRLRTDRANSLLRSSRLGIEEIARACGFTGGSCFTRAYRRRFGVSAREARSQQAGMLQCA